MPHLTFKSRSFSRELLLQRASCHMWQALRLLEPSLIRKSSNNLKLCWRTNSFNYILARVLKSCKRPLRYLIYNRCLYKFTHNLAKFFKITYKKSFFRKIGGSSLQNLLKETSFTGTSFGKYELRQLSHNFIS